MLNLFWVVYFTSVNFYLFGNIKPLSLNWMLTGKPLTSNNSHAL